MQVDWKDALRAHFNIEDEPVEDYPVQDTTEKAAVEIQKGRVDILLDKKGRKGKQATIIAGFEISDNAVAALAGKLKSKLGCGGSSRGGEILIQGDRRRDVERILVGEGIKCRVI